MQAACEDDTEEYKYVMFANEYNIHSSYVLIKDECANANQEKMIDKQRSILQNYFIYAEEKDNRFTYSDESVVYNDLLDEDIACLKDISVNYEKINLENVVLYSKNGNISLSSSSINLSGFIYAPNGKINISGDDINLNVIMIADKINLNADKITIKKNCVMAKAIGTTSDCYTEKQGIYTYVYDEFNAIKTIYIGKRCLARYIYENNFAHTLLKEIYGNGKQFNYSSDYILDSDTKGGEFFNRYRESSVLPLMDVDRDNKVKYTYDINNQLIRADDEMLDKTFLYEYDERGNLKSKREYLYTKDTPTSQICKDDYAYDGEWDDLLISYNGNRIINDEIGNPIRYKDWSFSWGDGNCLLSAKNAIHNLQYEYDSYGLRMKKIEKDLITTFTYVDRNIVEQDNGKYKLKFKYDNEDNIIGVNINGNDYYYVKNDMGDVMQIINRDGDIITEYHYSPWGKVEEIKGKLADTIGNLNPIRFHGYYYDQETGFYYIISRYYDPDTGRFISPDNFIYLGCVENLFAFCENNPIKNFDENGHLSWNGSTPIINSAQDAKDYDVILKCKKKLNKLGFTNVTILGARGYREATTKYKVRSFKMRCQFLAQCAYETAWGKYLTEYDYGNSDYFANKNYGYQYRGGGYIHITWKDCYQEFADHIGDQNVMKGADYVAKHYPWTSACWFWSMYKTKLVPTVNAGGNDEDTVAKVTKIVTGKDTGLSERIENFRKIKKLL